MKNDVSYVYRTHFEEPAGDFTFTCTWLLCCFTSTQIYRTRPLGGWGLGRPENARPVKHTVYVCSRNLGSVCPKPSRRQQRARGEAGGVTSTTKTDLWWPRDLEPGYGWSLRKWSRVCKISKRIIIFSFLCCLFILSYPLLSCWHCIALSFPTIH